MPDAKDRALARRLLDARPTVNEQLADIAAKVLAEARALGRSDAENELRRACAVVEAARVYREAVWRERLSKCAELGANMDAALAAYDAGTR